MSKKKKLKSRNEAKKISKEFLDACYYINEHSWDPDWKSYNFKVKLKTGWYLQWNPRTECIELWTPNKECRASLFNTCPSKIAELMSTYLYNLRM